MRLVWEVFKAVSVPVVGIGGIMTAEDALEFILVGASAVQIGTANFLNPKATISILEGIKSYLTDHNLNGLNQLRGKLEV